MWQSRNTLRPTCLTYRYKSAILLSRHQTEDVEPHVVKYRNHDPNISNIGTTNLYETVDKDTQNGSATVDSEDEGIVFLQAINLDVLNGLNEVEELIIEGGELTSTQPRRFRPGGEVKIDIIKPSDLHKQVLASTRLSHIIKYSD